MSITLHNELIRILDNKILIPYFQPIVSLFNKNIVGYEALIRGPQDSPLHNPNCLFDTAEYYSLNAKLEFACIKQTLESYAKLKLKEKLFINVSSYVLSDPKFMESLSENYLEELNVDRRSIVIELTENHPTIDYITMRDIVKHFQSMGFEIALDDLGIGYSGLRLWSELQPNYVKIDKYFMQGIPDDSIKLKFVHSIQNLANSLGCKIIAEGIETEKEFKSVESLGITYAQGFYFAKPAAQPIEKINNNLFQTISLQPNHITSYSKKTASHIARLINPVSALTPISDVMQLFQDNENLTILPLVNNKQASGIIFRDRFLSKLFSNRYGLELYGKKPIHLFNTKIPLSIDYNMPIELISQQLKAGTENDPAFIVTHGSEYFGVATVLDLLEEMTRLQIKNARHSNPLTLLPGSVPVNEHINRLLANKIPFAFAYFDLDHFKPYNDMYGYSAGDNIIKAVSDLLSQSITEKEGMIGHVGGDDFIVVLTCVDWFERCNNVLNEFEELVPSHYKKDDAIARGIYSENRLGEKTFFPIISLSVGVVTQETTSQCLSHVDLADLAANAKKKAKNINGNSLVTI